MEKYFILNISLNQIVGDLNISSPTNSYLDLSDSSTSLIHSPKEYTTVSEFRVCVRQLIDQKRHDLSFPKFKYERKVYKECLEIEDFLTLFKKDFLVCSIFCNLLANVNPNNKNK